MEKKISRQLLLWTVVWFAILGIVIVFIAPVDLENSIIIGLIPSSEAPVDASIIKYACWAGLALLLVVIAICQFLSVRLSIKRAITDLEAQAKAKGPVKQKTAPPKIVEKKPDPADEQRRALQLLSLLQREGRLVDFLKEDLGPYDDAQIGAAVRSIQESCQKTLNEYLTLKAIIEQEEGDEVTIQPKFDPNAIKLTGNVTGSPPFKGILQHRGWQATKLSMPTISSTQDPKIIAPAEVEIG